MGTETKREIYQVNQLIGRKSTWHNRKKTSRRENASPIVCCSSSRSQPAHQHHRPGPVSLQIEQASHPPAPLLPPWPANREPRHVLLLDAKTSLLPYWRKPIRKKHVRVLAYVSQVQLAGNMEIGRVGKNNREACEAPRRSRAGQACHRRAPIDIMLQKIASP